jgi:hypothetical protein
MEDITYIYELSKNGVPFYIGKTISHVVRKHYHELTYGKDIVFTIIDEVQGDKSKWKPLEMYWINQYQQWGFILENKNEGGGGRKIIYTREEIRQRRNEQTKQWHKDHPEVSKKYSEENKEKFKEYRETNKEKMLQQTKEWRKNNPELVKQTVKNYQEKNKEQIKSYVKEWQAANKEKIKEYNKLYNSKNNHPIIPLKILQYTLDGIFIKEWNSATEAALFLNKKTPSAIYEVCNGKRKTIYGYKWKYKN